MSQIFTPKPWWGLSQHLIRLTLPFLIGVCLCAPSWSQTVQTFSQPDGSAQRLSDLTRALLEHNPQLRAAHLSAEAVRKGVGPAGAPDNPTLSLLQDQVRQNPLNWGTSGSASWTWAQNIYWPGKKSLSAQVVSAQSDAAAAQTATLKLQLLAQLHSTWVNWQLTQAQLKLLDEQVGMVDQIKEVTRIRYAQNAAAFTDFINAQVTQDQLRSTLLATRLQADTLLSQIVALIGRDGAQPLNLQIETPDAIAPPGPPGPLDQLTAKALEQHPLLRISAATVLAAQHALDLAELGRRPDFNVAVSGYAAQPPWGLTHNNNFAMSVGMTLPIWFEQKEKQLIGQARLQLDSARQSDESQRQQVRLGVQAAWLQWQQNLEQLRLYQGTILQQAQLAYRLALKNYSANQSSYLDVLSAFNAERTAQSNALLAQAGVWAAKVALLAATGDDLTVPIQ
jgi:outer membrane protein TolC